MDKKPANGRRTHFSVTATTTPKLLVVEGVRHAVVFVTNAAVRVGHSGTLATLGLNIPADQGFTDNYSSDEWWVSTVAGSGTVSGFVVV